MEGGEGQGAPGNRREPGPLGLRRGQSRPAIPPFRAPMTSFDIHLKRAYDPPSADDGTRVLVDGLWPRGVSKEAARLDLWLREIAPSDGLRGWFRHDPERWEEFRARYGRELDARPDEVARLRLLAGEGRLTLVYGARDERHNNARALREYLVSGRRGS